MTNRLERGECLFTFEPIINKAITFADKKSFDSYHATSKEIKKFKGYIFQPERPMGNSELRRRQRASKEKRKGVGFNE